MTTSFSATPFQRMSVISIAVLAIVLALAGGTLAEDASKGKSGRKHEFGLRLGGWDNRGQTPPESGGLSGSEDGFFETSVKESAFYIEGYYAFELVRGLDMEIALGTVNRGSVKIDEGGAKDIGDLVIYPILLQFRAYPFARSNWRLQPYALFGGGMYYGRRNVQFTNSSYYYSHWEEESGTDFNVVFGGGFDYRMSGKFGLDFAFKYMPITFSKSLVTIEKYDAVTVTFGGRYRFNP